MIPIAFEKCSKLFKDGLLDYKKVKNKENKVQNKQSYILQKRDFKNLGFIIGTTIIIYIGMQTIISLLGKICVEALLTNLNETEQTLIIQIIAQACSIIPAILFLNFYINKEKQSRENKKLYISKPKMILITVAIIYILQLILSLIIFPALGIDYDVLDTIDLTHSDTLLSKFLIVFALAFVPAILEELFFRKALIDLLKPFGTSFAVILSALLFGLMHMNLSQSLFACAMGIIFGSIYIYTNDIKTTMLIHFINNGIAAISLLIMNKSFHIPDIELEIPYEAFLSIILLLFILIGSILGIRFFIKITKDKKWNRLPFLQKENEKNNYLFLFYDFMFDFSMIALIVMSILTENLLSSSK